MVHRQPVWRVTHSSVWLADLVSLSRFCAAASASSSSFFFLLLFFLLLLLVLGLLVLFLLLLVLVLLFFIFKSLLLFLLFLLLLRFPARTLKVTRLGVLYCARGRLATSLGCHISSSCLVHVGRVSVATVHLSRTLSPGSILSF